MGKISLILIVTCCMSVGLAQQILPSTDPNEIKFLLYTPQNPTTPQEVGYQNAASLTSSNYNGQNPTIFLVDGFLSNTTNSEMTKALRDALIAKSASNVFIVDWGALSGGHTILLHTDPRIGLLVYPAVILNIGGVAGRVADFTSWIHRSEHAPSYWIIGQSLGAHIAGTTGRNPNLIIDGVKLIDRVTGLDPAGLLFGVSIPLSTTLKQGDAKWVDVFHNGAGGMGDTTTDGDMDTFINGGSDQPGCGAGDLLANQFCDHQYGFKVFRDTISGSGVPACPCSGADCKCKTTSSQCTVPSPCSSPISVGYSTTPGTTGTYYLTSTTIY